MAEFGPGEALAGCPPLQQGPTAPKLANPQDSGRVGDHITNRSTNLTFSGLTGDAGAGADVELLVDGASVASGTANGAGVYSFTGVALAPRTRPYSVVARAQGGSAAFTSTARRVTIDTARPAVVARSVRPNPLHLQGNERLHAVYRVGEAAQLTMKVQRRLPTRTVQTFRNRNIGGARLVEYDWNGKNEVGRDVRAGRYRMELTVTDRAGNRTVERNAFRVVR